MKRFILTGAPGAGKTSVLRQLEREGYSVVEEAATDLIALWQARGIAEPWTADAFLDAVCNLQKQRQISASDGKDTVQFHDRSVFCTVALAAYLARPVTAVVSREVERVRSENVYQTQVFFLRNLGFIKATEARRISFDESLRFEQLHVKTYRDFGFDIVFIEPGSSAARAEAIKARVLGGSPSC